MHHNIRIYFIFISSMSLLSSLDGMSLDMKKISQVGPEVDLNMPNEFQTVPETASPAINSNQTLILEEAPPANCAGNTRLENSLLNQARASTRNYIEYIRYHNWLADFCTSNLEYIEKSPELNKRFQEYNEQSFADIVKVREIINGCKRDMQSPECMNALASVHTLALSTYDYNESLQNLIYKIEQIFYNEDGSLKFQPERVRIQALEKVEEEFRAELLQKWDEHTADLIRLTRGWDIRPPTALSAQREFSKLIRTNRFNQDVAQLHLACSNGNWQGANAVTSKYPLSGSEAATIEENGGLFYALSAYFMGESQEKRAAQEGLFIHEIFMQRCMQALPLDIQVPDTITTSDYQQERFLLSQFALSRRDRALQPHADMGLNYVTLSCEEMPISSSYRMLAQSVSDALTDRTVDSLVFDLKNLALKPRNEAQQAIQEGVIPFIADTIEILQNKLDATPTERQKIHAALKALDSAYGAFITGQKINVDETWNAVKPLLDLPGQPSAPLLETVGNQDQTTVEPSLLTPQDRAYIDYIIKLGQQKNEQQAALEGALSNEQVIKVTSAATRILVSLVKSNKSKLLFDTGAALAEVVNGSRQIIKEFPRSAVQEGHSFSSDHMRRGIMKLGSSRKEILQNFVDDVLKADRHRLLKEGDNFILTKFNGHNAVVRCYLTNGRVRSVNGFVGEITRTTGKNIINFR